MRSSGNTVSRKHKQVRSVPLVLVALWMLAPVAMAQQSVKRVLVLDWYNKDTAWNVSFERSFKAVLQSAPDRTVEYYNEYLETNRFPGEHQSQLLRDYLRQKYADRAIDVLVANSDTPMDFLLKYRNELFPHAPIVFVAARRPTGEELADPSGITGILNINTYKETLDLALQLHPDTEQLFVVSGTLSHDKRFEKRAREELQRYQSKLRITYLTDLSPAELLAQAKKLPKRSMVFYIWQQFQDENGRILEASVILNSFASSTPAPIYAMTETYLGAGLIGGYVTTPETFA